MRLGRLQYCTAPEIGPQLMLRICWRTADSNYFEYEIPCVGWTCFPEELVFDGKSG